MAAHAKLSASGADRWMTCPGSVVLEADIPDVGSSHAREGSAAHAAAEHLLLTGEASFELLDGPVPDKEYADYTVTAEMAEALDVYVDHCRDLVPTIKPNMVERRVSLEPLGNWAKGMFGTSDFLAHRGKTLYVSDYKHGMGVPVEAEGNPQFKYYATGGYLALTRKQQTQVDKVVCTVVQPRAPHSDGPVRQVTYSPTDLINWVKGELKPAVARVEEAEQADDIEPYLQPSEKGCKFCKARGICPKLRDTSMDAAMLEFDTEGKAEPRKPLDKLTPDEVAAILKNEKAIKDWLAGVAQLAQQMLEHGKDVTGGAYKLVAGRSSRKWASDDVAATKLQSMGYDADDLYSRKLLSPAQAEKLVGKANKENLADLIVKEEGKPTLAPSDDKRPALNRGPEADFESAN